MRIGLIGKYVELPDAYLSIVESLKHAGFHHGAKVEIDWIQAESVEGLLASERLRDLDGMVMCPGFGSRGFEGKIAAARFAREEGVPCLGICLGLQAMVSEFARNVRRPRRRQLLRDGPDDAVPGDRPHARSARHRPTWAARCASAPTTPCSSPGSKVADAYGEPVVSERHRHRYEFNPKYRVAARGGRAVVQRAHRPTTAWSSSSSCAITRTGSPRRRTPSSRAAPIGPTRCSAS